MLEYARTEPDRLTLEGTFGGEGLAVRLRKIERSFRLREEPLRFFYDGPIESER